MPQRYVHDSWPRINPQQYDGGFYRHSSLQKVCLQGQEAIDFTDNDIAILGNFPLSPHLTTLLVARNRVSSIQPTLSRSIPNLTNLSLSQNRVSNLVDIEPLAALRKLKHLSLLDNPITSKEVLSSSRRVRVMSWCHNGTNILDSTTATTSSGASLPYTALTSPEFANPSAIEPKSYSAHLSNPPNWPFKS